MVRSLIPLLMCIELTFVIINDNNGETLPNLIKLKTPIEKGERKEQQERTNIKSKDNIQKHKCTNRAHKKGQCGFTKSGQSNVTYVLNFHLSHEVDQIM